MSILLCTIIIIFALIIILMFLKGAEDGRGDYFDDIITAENVSLDRQLISSITLDELQVESALCTLDTFAIFMFQSLFRTNLLICCQIATALQAVKTLWIQYWLNFGEMKEHITTYISSKMIP